MQIPIRHQDVWTSVDGMKRMVKVMKERTRRWRNGVLHAFGACPRYCVMLSHFCKYSISELRLMTRGTCAIEPTHKNKMRSCRESDAAMQRCSNAAELDDDSGSRVARLRTRAPRHIAAAATRRLAMLLPPNLSSQLLPVHRPRETVSTNASSNDLHVPPAERDAIREARQEGSRRQRREARCFRQAWPDHHR